MDFAMNEADLRRALVLGAKSAVRRATNWSGDHLWPGDTGAENLIQVSVAEAIYDVDRVRRPAIVLEPTLDYLSGGAITDTRRVDIGIRRRKNQSWFAIVEVKKHPAAYAEDLRKICDVLEAVPSVRYAYLLTYFQKQETDRHNKKSLDAIIVDRAAAIRETAKTMHGQACRHMKPKQIKVIPGEGGPWRSAVMITRFARAKVAT